MTRGVAGAPLRTSMKVHQAGHVAAAAASTSGSREKRPAWHVEKHGVPLVHGVRTACARHMPGMHVQCLPARAQQHVRGTCTACAQPHNRTAAWPHSHTAAWQHSRTAARLHGRTAARGEAHRRGGRGTRKRRPRRCQRRRRRRRGRSQWRVALRRHARRRGGCRRRWRWRWMCRGRA